MPLQSGEMLSGKYRVEAEIGHGAYGRVYCARDIMLDRVVAVKELHLGEDDLGSTTFADYARRFRREARVQARFNHPNVVHVYELLEPVKDTLYLVMEYVDGSSLKERLERRGPLQVGEAVGLARELLAALAAVHADPRDIVHRDIKPSNVLLTKDGHAKLSDFGLAQVGDESARSGAGEAHPGTPIYMSPEQERTNAYLDPASDLYSAGCVLFEVLTGISYKSARRHKQDLRSLRPEVPQWLADVVGCMLAPEPAERADAEALLARLEAGQRADADARARQAAERRMAQEAAQKKADEEAQVTAQEAQETARRTAEETARKQADEEAKKEAQRVQEETARRAGEEAAYQKAKEARLEAQRAAEEAARKKAQADAKEIAKANAEQSGNAPVPIDGRTTPGLSTWTWATSFAALILIAVVSVLIVAALQPGAKPTPAPTAFSVAQSTLVPTKTQPSAQSLAIETIQPTAAAPTAVLLGTGVGSLSQVPRNRTVILAWSISSPIGVTNPWAIPGYTQQEGNVFMWEPLEYYGIFSSKEIPWLADIMNYNSDFTQLTIKLNPQATWSDGQPLTSADVAFTFNGQMTNDKLPYHPDFQQFVKDWMTPDDQTVILNFKVPAPRFKYEVLTFKFDTGIPIVPAHVLSQQSDVSAFQGGLDMPHSGPYNLVAWDQSQKVYDLRPDWWAVKAGKHAVPQVQRIVMVNIGGNIDSVAQRLDNNDFDSSPDVRAPVIQAISAANPKVTSWTGSQSPYGYFDWWPNSLWLNDAAEPYSDPNVRRAMCDTIDRNQINTVLYDGAKIATVYPFPLYPNLQKFADSDSVKAQFTANASHAMQSMSADLAESAKLMRAAGFIKNSDGFWAGKNGKTIIATINGFKGVHGDVAPVLVEMLKAGGFDASINFGNDAYSNMSGGKPGLYLFGHGASTVDPYAALNLYNSLYSTPIGSPASGNSFARYANPAFDSLLNTMAPLGSDDPAFQAAAAQAMGIYWRDTIDCPIIQWLHRIPYNQTYWTNWPLASNLADGETGAFWLETGMLVITGLEPIQ